MESTERKEVYKRKRDGAIVKAADWPDGDVSWRLEPLPLIAKKAVGTCSKVQFERTHEAVN